MQNAVKILISLGEFGGDLIMSDMFTDASPLSCSLEKLNDFYFKNGEKEIVTQTSNGRNCRTCCKVTVCKYSEEVVEKVENLIGEISKMNLPLSVNINCQEWADRKTSTLR